MTQVQEMVDETVASHGRRYAGLAVVAVSGADDAVAVHQRGSPEPPCGPDSLFQIGSVTKTFTATLLADLVLAGETTLDATLADLLPEVKVPRRDRPITLADLAAHTSGLPRLPPGLRRKAVRSPDNPYAGFTEDDLWHSLEVSRLRRDRSRYSNFGFAVLGHALARVGGSPYDALLRDRLTGRLGMTDTDVTPTDPARKVAGHTRGGRSTTDWEMPSMPAMGALWSSPADMARYLRAQLAPPSGRTGGAIAMTHDERAQVNKFVSVGLAWQRVRLPRTEHMMLWHNGGTGGFSSFIGLVEETGSGCVVLAGTARSVDGVGRGLLTRLVTSPLRRP